MSPGPGRTRGQGSSPKRLQDEMQDVVTELGELQLIADLFPVAQIDARLSAQIEVRLQRFILGAARSSDSLAAIGIADRDPC